MPPFHSDTDPLFPPGRFAYGQAAVCTDPHGDICEVNDNPDDQLGRKGPTGRARTRRPPHQGAQGAVRGLPCPGCRTALALTRGEHTVLDAVARGATTDDIGHLLRPGQDTGSQGLGSRAIHDVLRVLGATSRTQAVDIACRAKLLTPPYLRPPAGGIAAPQRSTAELLAAGLTYQEIAEQLGLPERTIRSRLRRLFADLGATGGPNAIWSLHAIGELPAHHPCRCRTRR
ncbi:sigma factor-like helix-turn-helix DNA-binding protein [Kitasatospora sp. NPDC059146]|uniref:helix-turn-helix transcriptional regulator n=1 Tax=unclassified Kitasatospora TaxID=2633591 RepID=UPI0036ABBA13